MPKLDPEMSGWLDMLDHNRAQRTRLDLGSKGWLVSWCPTDQGWLARVSVPGLPRTIERHGETRAAAIGKALGTIGLILEFKRTTPPKVTP